jgi:hypothetical protein
VEGSSTDTLREQAVNAKKIAMLINSLTFFPQSRYDPEPSVANVGFADRSK